MNSRPNVLVVAGPSGVGKGTILTKLRDIYQDKLHFSVSHTTRKPRPGEVDGREYYFVSKEEFERMIANDEFIEHAQFTGNRYGTSVGEIHRLQKKYPDDVTLLEIETNGVRQMQKRPDFAGQVRYAFIYPPNTEELETRLRSRQTETEETIKVRLQRAKDELIEMDELHKDISIINGDLHLATQQLVTWVKETFFD